MGCSHGRYRRSINPVPRRHRTLASRGGSAATAALVALGLAGYNVVLHRHLPRRWHVPVNLAASSALISLTGALGLGTEEVGLGRGAARHGARQGLVCAAAIGSGVTLVATPRRMRRQFADDRVRAESGREVAYETMARIPIGTALFEEIAFRGILTGLMLRATTPSRAYALSAAAFGLWHVIPTLDHHEGSPTVGRLGRTAAALGAVAVTAPAGLAFEALRRTSGSLVSPVMAHAALNVSAYLAAQAAHRELARAEAPPASGSLIDGRDDE